MAKDKKDKFTQLFESYISEKKILVVDTNGSSRAGISKSLAGIGAKAANITALGDYFAAVEAIQKIRPTIIVSDFMIGRNSAMELADVLADAIENEEQRLFIMVTGDSSQSTVAQAAEGEIDAFVLKPYTVDTFVKVIKSAALTKIYPNDYLKTIREGRKYLVDQQPRMAIEAFDRAMKLNPKPSLALFYKGQAELVEKLLDDAEGSYTEGLNHNDIHYKCLVGLFEVLIDRKKFLNAYEVVRKLSKYFPANPKRLVQVIRLAIQTKNYNDVEDFYESFKNIEVRNEEIIRHICAGLVVCARFFFRMDKTDKGFALLRKASVSAGGRSSILREIIMLLIEQKNLKESIKVLKRFPADVQNGADYVYSQILVDDFDAPDPRMTVQAIRNALQKGVESQLIYALLIRRLVEIDKENDAEDVVYEATKKFPDAKEQFETALKNRPAESAEAV